MTCGVLVFLPSYSSLAFAGNNVASTCTTTKGESAKAATHGDLQ